MLDQLAKSILVGTTLIEEDIRSVSSLISKQIASFASTSGKKVCYMTTGTKDEVMAVSKKFNLNMTSCIDELNGGSLPTKAQDDWQSADVIVIDSFSVFTFNKTEKEIIELINEISRGAKEGKTFVLTYESKMLDTRVDAYLKSMVDTIISVKTEINGNKIARLLYIPKLKGGRPYDKLVKFTVESDGVQIDTRETIG